MNKKKKWLIIDADGSKILFQGDAKQALEHALKVSKKFRCVPVEDARSELRLYPNIQ
jgi:hypothetical protein